MQGKTFPVWNQSKQMFLCLHGQFPVETSMDSDQAPGKPSRLKMLFPQEAEAYASLHDKLYEYVYGNSKAGFAVSPDDIIRATDRFWDESGVPYAEDAEVDA